MGEESPAVISGMGGEGGGEGGAGVKAWYTKGAAMVAIPAATAPSPKGATEDRGIWLCPPHLENSLVELVQVLESEPVVDPVLQPQKKYP